MPPFVVRTVSNFFEFIEAARLVHNEYCKSGYMEPRHHGLRVALKDLLPSATVFVAVTDNSVIGTTAAEHYCSAGLPCSSIFPNEIETLVARGCAVMESTKFACDRNVPRLERGVGNMSEVGTALVRALFDWGVKTQVDAWLVVVNPRVQDFYVGALGFKLLAAERVCSHVANAPGVLLSLPIKEFNQAPEHLELAQKLFIDSNPFVLPLKPQRRWTEFEAATLLLECPELLQKSSANEADTFIREYPRLKQFIAKVSEITPTVARPFSIIKCVERLLRFPNRPNVTRIVDTPFAFRTLIAEMIPLLELKASEFERNIEFWVDDLIPDQIVSNPELMGCLFSQMAFDALIQPSGGRVVMNITGDVVGSYSLNLNFSVLATSLQITDSLTQIIEAIGAIGEVITSESEEDILSVELEVAIANYSLHSTLIPNAEKQPEAASLVSPITILVVDDSVVARRMLSRLLGKWGHVVTTATSGVEAVRLAQSNRYDLILMDVQMPEMDGFTATRMIRESEQLSGRVGFSKIYALTAMVMPSDIREAARCGMDGHISKPTSSKDLQGVIRDVTAALHNPPSGARSVDEQSSVPSTS